MNTSRTRTILAALVGIVSIGVIGCSWLARSQEERALATPIESNEAFASGPHEADLWRLVAGKEARVAAEELAERAREQWVQDGLSAQRAELLADDVAALFTAYFEPNFDAYYERMNANGLRLGPSESFCKRMIEWTLYAKDDPGLASELPEVDRVRHLWNTPAVRRAEWQSVRPSSLLCGFGLVAQAGSAEFPSTGWYAQWSLFLPPSGPLSQVEGERLTQSKESAWILLEGRFAGGMQTHVRVNFYFDSGIERWVPITTVWGSDGMHRPFPML